MVSPGAIDMAGVLVLPRKEDFEKVDKSDIHQIYEEVCMPVERMGTLGNLISEHYGLLG